MNRNPFVSSLFLFLAVAAGLSTIVPGAGLAGPILMSEEKEIELGTQLHPKVLQDFGIYPNPELQVYVNSVGQELAAVSDRSHLDFTFTVLDDETVNAFATPGGYIYISRGMLAHLNSEAELAAILGHEIGHVEARHSVKRESSGKWASALATLAAIATRSTVAGSAANMVGSAMISGYSRAQELEADELGAKLMAKIGYSPDAMLHTVSLLKQRELFEIERARAEDREARIPHGLSATHPDNDKRFAEAIDAARQFQVAEPRPDGAENYLDQINGLKWGPKKSPGVVRANYYYHSKFMIKWKFPENWRVTGDTGRILAISDDNDAILQVFVVVPGRTMTAEDVINKKLGVNFIKDSKAITIAGMKAHIGTADRYISPFGARPARVAAILDNRGRRAYVFAGTGKHDLAKISSDSDFIATIFSLDKLHGEERNLGRPATLKIVRAEADTTMEYLAARSAVPTYSEQNLRLINGLYPSGEPEPGTLIKTVD